MLHLCPDDIADVVATCTVPGTSYGISAVVESSPARLLSKDEEPSTSRFSFSSSFIPPPGTGPSHLFTDLFECRNEMLLQHVLPFGVLEEKGERECPKGRLQKTWIRGGYSRPAHRPPSIHPYLPPTKLLLQNGKEPGLSQTSIWRLFRNNGHDVLAYT